MSFRETLLLVCLVMSLACLAGGYGMIAPWAGASALLFVILALLLVKKFSAAWLPPTYLAGVVCLAAAGLLAGASALLMILCATAALACWDLMNLHQRMAGSSPSATTRRYEQKHIRFLASGIGLGLLMAGSGSLVSVQIPFALMIVLVLVYVFSLNRIARYLEDRRGLHS